MLIWLGFAFSFFFGDLVGDRLIPSDALRPVFRGVIMDFNLDVAIFLGDSGLRVADEVTLEAIMRRLKFGLWSEDCGKPAYRIGQ